MSPPRRERWPDAIVIQGRTAAGEAVTVRLNDDGTFSLAAAITGADGAILDGSDASVKASVVSSSDDPTKNGLVALNPDGSQISGGSSGSADVQYTEGDVDTSITGTAALAEGPSNTLTPLQLDSGGNLKTALPTGAASSAKQDTGNTSVASIDTKTPALGQALAAGSVPVVLPAAQITTLTPPAAITGFATSAKQDTGNTSLSSIDGKTPSLGQALAAASVPVVLTAAQLSTLTPPAAITGFATETTLGTRLSESDFDTKAGSLTETAPATDIASSGLNGRLQRIAQRISSLITALGSPFQAGGSIGNTSFGAVLAPTTSGGCSTTHAVAAASTNATSVKASAGQLYAVTVFNVANYPVYLKLHNTAGTPTAGSGVVRTFGVQAGVPFTYVNPNGLAFGTGIAFTIVKDIADAGATAVAAGDCVVDLDWK